MARPLTKERHDGIVDDRPLNPADPCLSKIDNGREAEVSYISLAQEYLNGWMRVEIWGRIILPEVEPRYWVVIFERPGIDGHTWWRTVHTEPNAVDVQSAYKDEQQTVLVDVPELVDNPEMVEVGVNHWGSRRNGDLGKLGIVRLHSLNGIEDVPTGYARGQVGRCEGACFGEGYLANGEHRIFGGILAVELDQLKGNVLQGRPEIVQQVADDELQVDGEVRDALDPGAVLPALFIAFAKDEMVTVGFNDGADCRLQT